MWSVFKPKPKKPVITFAFEGLTAAELGAQHVAAANELTAQHAPRIRQLQKELAKLGHVNGETALKYEADLRRRIQEANGGLKAELEALQLEHREVFSKRAEEASEIITRTLTPLFMAFVKEYDTDQAAWLVEVVPHLREIVRHLVGHDLTGRMVALRYAEALLSTKHPAKVSDFARTWSNVGEDALWHALCGANAEQVRGALMHTETGLLGMNRGQPRLGDEHNVWNRKLRSDFLEC